MSTILEWLNQPMIAPALVTALVMGVFGFTAGYLRHRPWRVKVASNLLYDRVALLEQMISNLTTTCADNTARLAGIEEYLRDKQLAAAMFGKRPGEPDRPGYLGAGEARQLGNVEFRAGDFPVMLSPGKSSPWNPDATLAARRNRRSAEMVETDSHHELDLQ